MPELKGHCACGVVHYEIRGEPLAADVPAYPRAIDRDQAWPAASIARYNALPPRA